MKMGLEVHVELNTRTKLFCPCPRVADRPNTSTCPVCFGEPGAKPWLNKKAVEFAIKACLALNAQISDTIKFSRKSYFYPDLPKNFQITQYDEPLGRDGWIEVDGKRIGIRRIHLEEDPASISYPSSPQSSQYSIIDYNRSGSPLLEIVTEPWEGNPSEAKMFLRKLSNLLEYIGIFDPETCVIKADANISIPETGYVRVEIKNITGFREIEKALLYEEMRQKNALRFGQKISRETRGWDPKSGTTYPMRQKEEEEDYGYIPEPNIPPVPIKGLAEAVEMPELPWERARRIENEYGVAEDDAEVICSSLKLADMFEEVAKEFPGKGKEIGHWVRKEVLKVLNYTKKEIEDLPVGRLKRILSMLFSGKISDTLAKEMMKSIFSKDPEEMIGSSSMDEEIRKVLEANRKAVEDYLSGNRKALDFLVGKVMKSNPWFDAREVRKRIEEMIG